jgi:hypothetical protein
MAFAERTKVPIEQTRNEIEHTLKKYGADRFAYFTETGKAIIVFEAKERRVRFDLPLPKDDKTGRLGRQKWRALLLCIKAKLESVTSEIETFEEAFLAHVVLPDGSTVAEQTRDRIAQAYSGQKMVPMLPGPPQ